MKQLTAIKLDDENAERVRRDHAQAITDLQAIPAARARVVSSVSLANGVVTPVPHGLGAIPSIVTISPPRGATSAGYVTEVRTTAVDRSKFVQLQASGFGATVVVDIEVK